MGSYVQSNLAPGESILYEAHLHWIVYASLRAIFTLFIAPYLDTTTTEFVITNKRIIAKWGWVSRKTLELNLGKVESLNVHQGIFGRLFGYGTVHLIGTGGSKQPFPRIAEPLQLRKAFIDAQGAQ